MTTRKILHSLEHSKQTIKQQQGGDLGDPLPFPYNFKNAHPTATKNGLNDVLILSNL